MGSYLVHSQCSHSDGLHHRSGPGGISAAAKQSNGWNSPSQATGIQIVTALAEQELDMQVPKYTEEFTVQILQAPSRSRCRIGQVPSLSKGG